MLSRAKSIGIRLWKDKGGASLLEYSLLIGIIAVLTVGLITAIGGWVTGRWSALCTALSIACT